MKEITLMLLGVITLFGCSGNNSTRQSATYVQKQNTELSTPIEAESFIAKELGSSTAKLLADIVKLYGYKCDSISSARNLLFSNGFKLRCNNHRYAYEIEDKGGRWVVTLD